MMYHVYCSTQLAASSRDALYRTRSSLLVMTPCILKKHTHTYIYIWHVPDTHKIPRLGGIPCPGTEEPHTRVLGHGTRHITMYPVSREWVWPAYYRSMPNSTASSSVMSPYCQMTRWLLRASSCAVEYSDIWRVVGVWGVRVSVNGVNITRNKRINFSTRTLTCWSLLTFRGVPINHHRQESALFCGEPASTK